MLVYAKGGGLANFYRTAGARRQSIGPTKRNTDRPLLAGSGQKFIPCDRGWRKHPARPIQHSATMKWRVRLMRKAGRRIPWKVLINEPGLIGTIRTHSCTYGDQEPYSVAVLNVSDSPIAEGIELLEAQLLMMGDQA